MTYLSITFEDASAFVLLGWFIFGESLVSDLLDVNAVHLQLHASCHCVNLVNTLEGDSVALVRASHKKKTAVELLEEYDTLASESAREENHNFSRFQRLSKFGLLWLLLANISFLVLSGIPLEIFDH